MRKDENAKTNGAEFFAAVNSGVGFVSFYGGIFCADIL